MIYNVEQLKGTLDIKIAAAESRVRGDHATAWAQHERALQRWREDRAPRLATLLRRLSARAGRGESVTADDLRPLHDTWHRTDNLVAPTTRLGPEPDLSGAVSADVRRLRAFLDLVSEETITTNALARSGFSNVGRLLTY